MMNPNERMLHYRILRRLGAGGMGEVYLAEDEKLGRRVALKLLPRSESADPERRERLKREARALASLSDPGIAGIFALEEHEGRLFLVMEYIEGETLGERIARRPLPVTEVVDRGRVLAQALAHAHARGVIHRDIKPSNILITPGGATKLADFGLAFTEGETRLTAEGSTAGTADYMSPEQTRGSDVDRRSDLFSLGVVLYESLTGVRPFHHPTLEGTIHAIRADDPEPLTAVRSGIPLELERIVTKLLRKEPAARYQTADDLASDLGTLAGGLSAHGGGHDKPTATMPAMRGSEGPGRTSQAAEPARRHKPRRWLLVVPALLVLIAAGYLLSGRLRGGAGEAEAAQRSIAVVSFQNVPEPGDPKREAVMAASLLTVGLGQSQGIPVVGAQRVHDVVRQMGKADQAISGSDALLIGKRAGAAYVVTGYVFQTSPSVVLGAEVASVADGSVLTSRRVQVPASDQAIFAAVDSLTLALRDALSHAGFGVRHETVDVAAQTTRNPVAYRAYAHGLDLLYRSEFKPAHEALLSAVQADSTFAQAWYHLAVATWWTADFPEATREVEAALRQGSKLSPRDRAALKGLQLLIQKRYPEAVDRYQQLVARYPDDKELWYGLGEARFHGGHDFDGARQAMNQALALDPQFGIAWAHIMDVDIHNEDLRVALEDTDRFRSVDPGNPFWMASKVLAFGALGYPESSLAYARMYRAAVPNQFWIHRQTAVLQSLMGHPDSARALIPDAARLAGPAAATLPATADGYLSFSQGRLSHANQVAVQAIQQYGTKDLDNYFGFLALRIWCLLRMGHPAEAVHLALQAEATPPLPGDEFAMSRSEIVGYCVQAGDLAAARSVLRRYEQALGPKPDYWLDQDRRFCAGLIALGEGRAKEAAAMFRTSLPLGRSLDFRENMRRWALARALIAAGDHDAAVPELEKVSRRMIFEGEPDPAFSSMILLAKEYERLGRREDALALYRRVAFQFRTADPGVSWNEEAKAGIQRLELAIAKSKAS